MINNTSLSFEELKRDAISYLNTLPDGTAWKDFYLSSKGAIVIDLLAGYSAWMAYKYMMNRGESYLSEARLRSSILHLAKSKGIFLAPATPLTVVITVTPNENLTLAKGTLIGTVGTYQVFTEESIDLVSGDQKEIRAVIGNKEKIKYKAISSDYFQEVILEFNNQFITNYFEEIKVNNIAMDATHEPTSIHSKQNTSHYVLRYVGSAQSTLTFGNEVLGYGLKINDNITYETLTYAESIDQVDIEQIDFIYGTKDSVKLLLNASKYTSTEGIRKSALYSSINGTLVTSEHYESTIIHLFDNYLKDLYVYDEYPKEIIYLLPSAIWTDETLNKLTHHINTKKGTAVLIEYKVLEEVKDGIDISFSIAYQSLTHSYNDIKIILDEFKKTLVDKIVRTPSTITTSDLVMDLNKTTPESVRFYLTSDQQDINLELGKFIKSVSILFKERK